MRKLTDARDKAEARRIVDALLVAGIEAEARSDAGTEIWVIENEQLEAARAKLDAIQRGITDDVAARAEAIRRNKQRSEDDHRQRTHDMARRWGGRSPATAGFVTMFLLVGSIVIGLVSLFADSSDVGMWNLTIDHYASTEPLQRIRAGEIWRIVTPIFLHFGIFHLAFNMLWLYRLGAQIEQAHGPAVMIAVVLVSAISGNLGQYWVSGPGFGGMSGVVYGLFGFVWMYARFDRRHAYAIGGADTVLIMLWFVGCATGLFGPIANVAHAAGLCVGLLLGLAPYIRHVRARAAVPDFADGSWAAVHLTGFRRFARRFITPYVPLWFLALAAFVIALEPITKHRTAYREQACATFEMRVRECLRQLPDHATQHAFAAELEAFVMPLQEADTQMEAELACAQILPEVEDLAARFGCTADPGRR